MKKKVFRERRKAILEQPKVEEKKAKKKATKKKEA